jgi:hypothetical protein
MTLAYIRDRRDALIGNLWTPPVNASAVAHSATSMLVMTVNNDRTGVTGPGHGASERPTLRSLALCGCGAESSYPYTAESDAELLVKGKYCEETTHSRRQSMQSTHYAAAEYDERRLPRCCYHNAYCLSRKTMDL